MDVFEHNPGDHEDPLAGPLWLVGVLSIVLLAVIVLGVSAMFYHAREVAEEERIVLQPAREFNELKAQQLEQLTAPPRRQEFKEGEETVERIIIPIDQAMELVVQEHSTGN